MAISLDLFASRLDHACEELEEGVASLKRDFDTEVQALGAALEGNDAVVHLAAKAIFTARLNEMERRLGQVLSA